MSSTKKPYRFNNKDVVVKAENALYNGDIANVENAEDAIDNLNGRVAKLELGGGGGSYNNPFSGKEIAFIGDSFTAPDQWTSRMCNLLGAAKGYNAATSGCTWKRRIDGNVVNSAYARARALKAYYDNQAKKPDYIIVVMGTNDAINMSSSGWKIGDIDYGIVRVRTRLRAVVDPEQPEDTTEHNGRIYYDSSKGMFVNEILPDANGKAQLYSYTRYAHTDLTTAFPVDVMRQTPLLSPETYIYDAACDSSIASENVPTSKSGVLDTEYITGGIQATLLYLMYYFSDAVIKIGYTPAGAIHSFQRLNNIHAVCTRLQEVAEMYGIGYIDTLKCGISVFAEGQGYDYFAGSHPTAAGQQRIGEYMARIMLNNV